MSCDTWRRLLLSFWSCSWCSAVRLIELWHLKWTIFMLPIVSWCSSRELWHLKWAIVKFLIVFLVFSRSPSKSWHLTRALMWWESTWEGGVAGSRLVVGGVGGRGKDVVGLKVVDDGSDWLYTKLWQTGSRNSCKKNGLLTNLHTHTHTNKCSLAHAVLKSNQ